MILAAFILALTVGLFAGVILHATFAKRATASKSELADWALRLESALAADASIVKSKVLVVMAEIKQKL